MALRRPQVITSADGSAQLAPFFTKAFPFSNHFPCHFVVDGVDFCCSEQCYMWLKARSFGDDHCASAILRSNDAAQIKRLGSRIRFFDHYKWRQISVLAMVIANLNKFRQNADLMKCLLEIGLGVTLVECAPNDCYWGIGVPLSRIEEIRNVAKWKGKNVLGRTLNVIRDRFLRMAHENPSTAVRVADTTTPGVESRARLVELPLIGSLSLDVVRSEEEGVDASAIQSSSSVNVEENVVPASARQSLTEFENVGFGTDNREEEKLADEFERFSVSERKVVEYVVCQIEENVVIVGKLKQNSNLNHPFFMSVSNELAEKSENFQRKLQLGDIVGIGTFEWREGYRHLAKRESEKSSWIKMWYVQKINWQASAVELCYINYATWRENSGIVLRSRESISAGVSRRLCVVVISSGLQMSSRCYRRQLVDLDMDSLVEGQLIKVWTAVLPEQYLVESSYVLPPLTQFKLGTEKMIEDGKGVLACIGPHEPWPHQHLYPLKPEMSQSEIELAEKIFSAVIAYGYEDEERRIVDCRFEGSAMFSEDLFWLKFSNLDNVRMKKLKGVWEVDAQVLLRPAMDSKHFAAGVVRKLDVESVRSFGKPKFDLWVAVKITNVQQRKNRDVSEELENAEEGGYFVAHPLIPQGMELRRDCFASNLPSRVASLNTNQGKLMRAVMGRPGEDSNVGQASSSSEREFHPLMRRLNENQKVTAKLLLDDACRLVYQNAPPGVGKTYVASVVSAILLAIKEGIKIAVVTSANLPLAKLAQELDEVLGSSAMEESGSVAFFSGYAKEKYRQMIEQLKQHILVSKLKSEEIQRKLEERSENNAEMRDVLEYCNNFENRPRLTKERRMATLYSEVADLRITFATASMAENMLWTALAGTSVMIFDEATQGSWVVLAHLVARLPKLEKIFVTGDRYQLGVHLQELPKILQKGFGLESMVDQLVQSPLVEQTKLVKCYRMHPLIVEVVSYASYEQNGELLEIGRSANERSLLTASQFPLPMQNCPIVLVNIAGICRQDTESHSLTNDMHTASAVQLSSALIDNLSNSDFSLVVICLYLFQKECIRREFDDLGLNILVVSVDEYQAQEADITIVVTTRSSFREGNLGESSDFLKDSQRATVALSRARHGIFLIGDFTVLGAGQVWQRFVERASAYTQAVGKSYLQLLRTGQFRRDRYGQLLDSEYRIVGDWLSTGNSGSAATAEGAAAAGTSRHTDESWRQWKAGRPMERKRMAEDDNDPKRRRDENWRQFSGQTFTRGRGGGGNVCFKCGRAGHWAKECGRR